MVYLLSEHGGDGDKEKALQLAQTAKEAAPVGLFKESTAKLPGNPSIQYHVGMTSQKIGDTKGARLALSRAVTSPVSFEEGEQVQMALAVMNEERP